MTGDEVIEAYRRFTDEAVRLETRQSYKVPDDDERQRAFREGRPLPPRPEKSASVQLIKDAVSSGRRLGRIHVIEWPLSDYVRYEIEAAYLENAAAGEEILIVDRAADPRLENLCEDFALFDSDTDHAAVIWYRYTPAGELVAWEAGSGLAVAACQSALALARHYAVPLSEFLASAHG